MYQWLAPKFYRVMRYWRNELRGTTELHLSEGGWTSRTWSR